LTQPSLLNSWATTSAIGQARVAALPWLLTSYWRVLPTIGFPRNLSITAEISLCSSGIEVSACAVYSSPVPRSTWPPIRKMPSIGIQITLSEGEFVGFRTPVMRYCSLCC